MRRELDMDSEKELTAQCLAVAEIAHRVFGLKSLDTQNSDSLDFKDFSIWQIEAALNAAYEAGRAAGKKNKTDGRQQ
jgi:hypothetical protein